MCTLYSTLPNELTAAINHERMPVLLTSESEWMTWLTGTPERRSHCAGPILPKDAYRWLKSENARQPCSEPTRIDRGLFWSLPFLPIALRHSQIRFRRRT